MYIEYLYIYTYVFTYIYTDTLCIHTYTEELWPWETVPGKVDVLGSEFHCRRLYGAAPKKIYQVIETWRILGSAPLIRDPCRPTIPPGTLPKDRRTRQELY